MQSTDSNLREQEASAQEYQPEMLADYLKIYYKKLFPTRLFCKWLSYADPQNLSHREFNFTLQDDVYIRYLSFDDQATLQKELERVTPFKVDLGAVYSIPPKMQKSVSQMQFQPKFRELVFDIDISDYNDVRFCCDESRICSKCWPLIVAAVRILDEALRTDFGFQKLLWIYSGRRGVHLWVCDRVACELSGTARSAIVEYLSMTKRSGRDVLQANSQAGGGGAGITNSSGALSTALPPRCLMKVAGFSQSEVSARNVVLQRQHPFASRAFETIQPLFAKYAAQHQQLLATDERVTAFLDSLPKFMNEEWDLLRKKWINSNTSDNHLMSAKELSTLSGRRWATLDKYLQSNNASLLAEIVLSYMYPRLDANVSISMNHLLKAPFCVHPKTGRVCIPFDPNDVENFDPNTSVPIVSDLLNELKENQLLQQQQQQTMNDNTEKSPHLLPYKLTKLKKHIEFFENFVNNL